MTETHKASQRHRRVEDEEIEDPAADTGGSPSEEVPDAPPTKKRRRGAKANSEKKFECKTEGCGKSYSRAEHLYRHQLNRKRLPQALCLPLSDFSSRHSKEHIPMRLSRVQSLLRPSRFVPATS